VYLHKKTNLVSNTFCTVDLNQYCGGFKSILRGNSTAAATKLVVITKLAHEITSKQMQVDQYYKYVVLVLFYIAIGNMRIITPVVGLSCVLPSSVGLSTAQLDGRVNNSGNVLRVHMYTCTTQNHFQTYSTNILHVIGNLCPRGTSSIVWIDKKRIGKISKTQQK
jgi:hypothetical protein